MIEEERSAEPQQTETEREESSVPNNSPSRMFVAAMIAAFVMLALSPFLIFLGRYVDNIDGEPAWDDATLRPPIEIRGVFRSINGEEIDLGAMKGKVVFLNFWATWCTPCIEEMPSMQVLYESLRPGGLEMVAITSEQPAVVERFLKNRDYRFPIGLDPDRELVKAHAIEVLPTTIIIDKQGREVIRSSMWMDWTEPRVAEKIRKLLEE